MPSDPRALEALDALAGAIRAWQTGVTLAAERIAAFLAAHDVQSPEEAATLELGEFAAGRIDVDRFASLSDERHVLDQFEVGVLRHAQDMLTELAARPASAFLVDVPSGGRLTGALGNFFHDVGRCFGAMLVADLVRTQRFEREHLELLHGFARLRWSRTERAASPPVVVTVDGADLWAGELAQYLDGNQRIVLVVRPPAPPASLIRLVTPGTLVLQTSRIDALAPVLAAEGPAVAAVITEGAAEFVHLPGDGPIHERIAIVARPRGPRRSVESWTAWQQQQELAQLEAIAAQPLAVAGVAGNGTAAAAAASPADRLAAWQLSQADAPGERVP